MVNGSKKGAEISMKKIAIVGAGPGLGLSLAKKFGSQGFEVILLARNEQSLAQYVADLTKLNIVATSYTIDAMSEDSIKQTFSKIFAVHHHLDVVIYNVGNLAMNRPMTLGQSEVINSFQMDVASALLVSQLVQKNNQPEKHTTLLFTGGGLALKPEKQMTTLSMGKAALRSLVYILAEEARDENTYVGTVTISGGIKPDTFFSPNNIAEVYWEMYQNQKQTEYIYQNQE